MKLHVVLSFHACGANRDDDYHVPLPPWVEDAVERDPDGLLFQDRAGTRSDEYLSLWADDAPMPVFRAGEKDGDDENGAHPPRSPLECYRDMMRAFRATFEDALKQGGLITEVLVGCGPCGELRFPAYAMGRGWRSRASASSSATTAARSRAWRWRRRRRGARSGARGAARRRDVQQPAGRDGLFRQRRRRRGAISERVDCVFRGWVFRVERVERERVERFRKTPRLALDAPADDARAGFAGRASPREGALAPVGHRRDRRERRADDPAGRERTIVRRGARQVAGRLDHLREPGSARADGRWDSEYGRFFLGWYSGELAAHGERVMRAAGECFAGCAARLALKCAGIHWWYRTRSHAAELTTGYYNVSRAGGSFEGGNSEARRSRVSRTAQTARRASVDGWVPGGAQSRPSFDGLGSPPRGGGLSQNQSLGSFGSITSVDESRESRGGPASFGANRPSGYDRVMAVAKSAGASVTFTCAEMSDREHDPEHRCGPEGLMRQVVRCAARHGVDVAAENALYRCDATAFKQMVRNCKRGGGESSGAGMTSFTFLRMCDSLFEERNFREFATFVGDLSGNDGRVGSP